MGVEARRDQHEVGLECPHGRLDALVPGPEVVLVRGAGRQRHVHQRLVLILRPTGAGIERPLVHRDEEHRRVRSKDVLGAVSVVDVPVDDRDPPDTELGLRVTGRDCDVVEEAEAHRPVRRRVVPRRPYQREPIAADRFDRGAGREHRRLVCRVRSNRVRVDERRPGDSADELEQLRTVASKDVLLGGRLGLAELELLLQDAKPLLPLGVVARRVESGHLAVAHELHGTSTTSGSSRLRQSSWGSRPIRGAA